MSARRILCFGDSLTAGYTEEGYFPYSDELRGHLQGAFEVDHIGMCGWTTAEMIERKDFAANYDCFENEWAGLEHQLNQNQYDMVCILGGTNDIGTGEDPEEIVDNLSTLVEICLSSVPRVALITVPACGMETPDNMLHRARKFVNDGIRSIASQHGGRVVLVDAAAALPNGRRRSLPPELRERWDPDELHLSDIGSKVLGRTVFDAIRTSLA